MATFSLTDEFVFSTPPEELSSETRARLQEIARRDPEAFAEGMRKAIAWKESIHADARRRVIRRSFAVRLWSAVARARAVVVHQLHRGGSLPAGRPAGRAHAHRGPPREDDDESSDLDGGAL